MNPNQAWINRLTEAMEVAEREYRNRINRAGVIVEYTGAPPSVDPPRNDLFPHVCPKCSAPAYVGLTQVDCSKGCK